MVNKIKPVGDKATLYKMYHEECMTLAQIAAAFDCSNGTILNRMRQYGIPMRSKSEAMKIRPVLWGAKIGAAQKGRRLSEEQKAKISATRVARNFTPWNKGKRKAFDPALNKLGKRGQQHWNWKGGISAENIRLRQTSEYKAWRDAVFRRDNYVCQFCEKHHRDLEAHHIIPMKTLLSLEEELRNELIWNPDNGWTACKKCHKEIHSAVL